MRFGKVGYLEEEKKKEPYVTMLSPRTYVILSRSKLPRVVGIPVGLIGGLISEEVH